MWLQAVLGWWVCKKVVQNCVSLFVHLVYLVQLCVCIWCVCACPSRDTIWWFDVHIVQGVFRSHEIHTLYFLYSYVLAFHVFVCGVTIWWFDVSAEEHCVCVTIYKLITRSTLVHRLMSQDKQCLSSCHKTHTVHSRLESQDTQYISWCHKMHTVHRLMSQDTQCLSWCLKIRTMVQVDVTRYTAQVGGIWSTWDPTL